MPDLLAELAWRGLVHQATPALAAHLGRGPTAVYAGFDPTAPSLQLGNLIPLTLLRHFQRAGHRPIVLMGGGTGLIGDPSGKRDERPLLSREEIRENLHRQRDQMAQFLDFDPGPAQARVLNNADWLAREPLLDFLRDTGKHFTVNVLLQKEAIEGRLQTGISYTEFSYVLLQAFDFLHLWRSEECTVQVGGSDQWGNITAGIDLIRKVESAEAHGLVAPLVTTASGAKFGKTEAGALWLDPARTSPYKLYQYWINSDDRDVARYLKFFTARPAAEIAVLLDTHTLNPGARAAQRCLAADVTALVHGVFAAASAAAASALLFEDSDPRRVSAPALATLSAEIPTAPLPAVGDLALVDALTQVGLATSKSDARRAIQQGGIYVNQVRVQDPDRRLGPGDGLAGGRVLLRRGKKDYALLEPRTP
jgi:tyrosyl-tRNA synthetase